MAAPLREQRVRTVFESHIAIFQLDIGFAISADREVLHIPGMVAVGTIEPVLLALGIEVSARRFEVGPLAFRNRMEVDGMLSGSQIVEFEFEGDARSLIPDKDISNGFSLSIFEFDFGLGRAPGRQGNQREEQSEGERGKVFHRFDLLVRASWQQGL